jgi:hypothetical protein
MRTNIHTTEFDLAGELFTWNRQGLGRPLTTKEHKAILDALETNEIYSEFFDSLEDILAEAM